MIQRRAFLTGLAAAFVTAPAIVRASSLMPVKQMIDRYADVSMRNISDYVPGDQAIDRLDILFGRMYVRPEWMVLPIGLECGKSIRYADLGAIYKHAA